MATTELTPTVCTCGAAIAAPNPYVVIGLNACSDCKANPKHSTIDFICPDCGQDTAAIWRALGGCEMHETTCPRTL